MPPGRHTGTDCQRNSSLPFEVFTGPDWLRFANTGRGGSRGRRAHQYHVFLELTAITCFYLFIENKNK